MRVEMKASIKKCLIEYFSLCTVDLIENDTNIVEKKKVEKSDDDERINESEAHDTFDDSMINDTEAVKRSEWCLSHPSQMVLVVARIAWSAEMSSCIHKMGKGYSGLQSHSPAKMIVSRYNRYLSASTAVVQRGSSLDKLERSRAVNLIIADIYARDVMSRMEKENVTSINDFFWTSQIRYVSKAADAIASSTNPQSIAPTPSSANSSNSLPAMNVFLHQLSYSMEYGYEYLGAAPRLVVTPMTERAFLTMTTALSMGLGANPTGPAGTGKTETTKELSRWIAVQCVVFNCGDGLDAKFMAGFFNGLASTGAWACLDEFNRIDVEVLSVVAVQLLTLQTALRSRSKTVYIDGPREVSLVRSAAVFATMNPTYSGRVELPMNMKVITWLYKILSLIPI